MIKRKLSFIGLLMAASWLLLLCFVLQWVFAQYRNQKQQLRQQISVSLNQEKGRLNDSLASTLVHSLFSSQDIASSKMSFKIHVDSFDQKGDFKRGSMKSNTSGNFPPFDVTGNPTVIDTLSRYDSGAGTKQVSVQMQDTTQVRLILQNILKALVSSDSKHDLSVLGKTDTVLFRHSFSKILAKDRLTMLRRPEATRRTDTDFVFKLSNPDLVVAVGGANIFIFKNLVPQIAFSFTLIFLVGLAFIWAFRNLKKQISFNKQKDQFIANISHELKTPVATAKIAIEALLHHNAMSEPARTKRYLNVAEWELNRLQNMMKQVMEALPGQESIISLQKTNVAVKEILLRVAEIIRSSQKETEISFTWQFPQEPMYIWADELHFTNIIYNIMDNAIKYGGTKIDVTATEAGSANVTIKISDNGPGIPVLYRNKIFDRFFRIPSGNVHNVNGYGLGLSYVRQMVNAHGGNIRLAPGPITCFIINWPKKKS